jgi:hypothetical protein
MKSLILALVLSATTAGAAAGADRLPEEDLGEMAAGRQRLEAALDSGARALHPELSARAEAGFECWIGGIEDAGPGACRDAFLIAVAALEELRQDGAGSLMAAQ